MPRPTPPRVAAPLVLLLAGTAATPAAAADPDPWFGHDKLLHFEATATIAAAGYAGAAVATEDWRLRAAAGFGLAVTAGAAKELWDLDGHGDASWRDFTWDVVGALTGVAVARTVDWVLGRLGWPAVLSR